MDLDGFDVGGVDDLCNNYTKFDVLGCGFVPVNMGLCKYWQGVCVGGVGQWMAATRA